MALREGGIGFGSEWSLQVRSHLRRTLGAAEVTGKVVRLGQDYQVFEARKPADVFANFVEDFAGPGNQMQGSFHHQGRARGHRCEHGADRRCDVDCGCADLQLAAGALFEAAPSGILGGAESRAREIFLASGWCASYGVGGWTGIAKAGKLSSSLCPGVPS